MFVYVHASCKNSRPSCFTVILEARRICEYYEDTLEYWVNVRTSGKLSREDLETLSITREHDQEVMGDDLRLGAPDMQDGAFPEFGSGQQPDLEGDSRASASRLHAHMRLATHFKLLECFWKRTLGPPKVNFVQQINERLAWQLH